VVSQRLNAGLTYHAYFDHLSILHQFVLKLAKVAQDVWAFAGKNIFLMADLMVAMVVTVVMYGVASIAKRLENACLSSKNWRTIRFY
jgi:hypothetical protein